jgi:hypothetical protein
LASPSTRIGSATISITRQRGFRLAYGSWKIICMRRRNPLASADARSMPSNSMRPLVGS